MQLFSCSFLVPQSDLRLERSRYMSRHLDQTGPNMTIAITELVLSDWERSQSSRFICLYLHLSWCCMVQAVPGPVGLQFGCHQSRSDCGSLPCHEHQRFITSALLHRCVFFLLTLFSDSSKGPPLLASPSHAQVHFSDFSTLLFG